MSEPLLNEYLSKKIVKLEGALDRLKKERDLAFDELDDETVKRILEEVNKSEFV